MTSINFQFFIENDANPFILFTNRGRIKYLNNAAEVLMGSCKPKEIFDLALANAPQTFGFKKSALNLSFNSFQFYGVNVLYENEECIGIHLYNKATEKIDKEMVLDGFTLTDINVILQANIELFNIHYEGEMTLMVDYSIPEFQMHQNNFSLLLRHLFAQFQKSKILEITIKVKLGEQIIIKNNKYAIILLKMKSDMRDKASDKELKNLADKNHINLQLNNASLSLEIPAVK